MIKEEAKKLLNELISQLGNGFHPDNLMTDYFDHEGKEFFTKDEAESLQTRFDDLLDSFSDDEIYSLINEAFEDLGL